MQASGSSSSSAICGTGSPPNRHAVSSTSVPSSHAPHGDAAADQADHRTNLVGLQCRGQQRELADRGRCRRPRAARRRPRSCARTQSPAPPTTSTSMSLSTSGTPGCWKCARHRAGTPCEASSAPNSGQATPPSDPASSTTPARAASPAGMNSRPTTPSSCTTSSVTPSATIARVYDVADELVARGPQRDLDRVQTAVVESSPRRRSRTARTGRPPGSCRPTGVASRVDRAVLVSGVLPGARPRRPASSRCRLDGHPPPRRRAGEQHAVRAVHQRARPTGSQLHPTSDLLARRHRRSHPLDRLGHAVRRCPGGRRGSGRTPRPPRRPASPAIIMNGTFCSWALRIFFCIRSSDSSTSTRSPCAFICFAMSNR